MFSKKNSKTPILILGIGNVLMGDEGIGVHVIRHLQKQKLPAGVACLDGGTSGITLLEPIQQSEQVILIDATLDGAPTGTVRRLRPRFSSDYPKTLTAHDIGLKDLLDALYLLGDPPAILLLAVSIGAVPDLTLELSAQMQSQVPRLAGMVVQICDSLLEKEGIRVPGV